MQVRSRGTYKIAGHEVIPRGMGSRTKFRTSTASIWTPPPFLSRRPVREVLLCLAFAHLFQFCRLVFV
jgi:hypothetical protein